MADFFEAVMIVSFGLSWPLNILKSLRAKTAKGKSILFLFLIFTGYICGIAGKLISRNITYVFIFYVINLVMVGIDIVLYFRNKKLDMLHDAANA